MSSGPVGLDSKEYAYDARQFDSATSGPDQTVFIPGWLVTKIQFFALAGGVNCRLVINGHTINVVDGGCLCLEPNGALRAAFDARGTAWFMVVEYWLPGGPAPA